MHIPHFYIYAVLFGEVATFYRAAASVPTIFNGVSQLHEQHGGYAICAACVMHRPASKYRGVSADRCVLFFRFVSPQGVTDHLRTLPPKMSTLKVTLTYHQ